MQYTAAVLRLSISERNQDQALKPRSPSLVITWGRGHTALPAFDFSFGKEDGHRLYFCYAKPYYFSAFYRKWIIRANYSDQFPIR